MKNNEINVHINQGESYEDFCIRIYNYRLQYGLSWTEVANIINTECGYTYSPDTYRKRASKVYIDHVEDTEDLRAEILNELKVEKYKLIDERNQINSVYKRISREDTLKEMAKEVASHMNSQFKLPNVTISKTKSEKEAILEISDWHYGIEIDNYWNKFDPDIAKNRIAKLKEETKRICAKEGITHLHVVNLGDLIAGRIHLPLRINSRFDVITQIMEVSELLAQMLSELATKMKIDYYDTLDNHSRLEPNLKESMQLESLARITAWYLKDRVKNITIHENTYADDIITFNVLGHNVVGVHGDKDKPGKVIDNMTLMTHQHYDLALTAHLHHFSAEEKNETVLVSNSSLMGTDEFAETLRLSAKPSQNLIIVSKNSPCENIYRILL